VIGVIAAAAALWQTRFDGDRCRDLGRLSMAEIVEVLAEFRGIAVKYDPAKNPFFKPIVTDNLRKITSCDAGQKLLELIADASPRSRADFPGGINVMIVPQAVSFVQSGHKAAFYTGGGMNKTLQPSADPRHSPKGCPFYIVGGSQNAAKDPVATTNGQGSVCDMYFTNVQVVTTKGEATYPFIVLAHELIHSYHCLYGIKKDGSDEELWTSGLGTFADEKLSENVIRDQLKVKPRIDYF
jgi:Effector protein